MHTENQLPRLPGSALKVPGGGVGGWWVASYPLLSLTPTQVEVELGCDNYPSRFEYGWGRLGPGDGYYVSPRTPPMYTSAQSPPAQVTSLAPFLPRGPTQQYYSGNSPYSSQSGYPPVLTPNHISPNSQRKDRTGPKSGRPYSADVGRLLSVQEGSEGSDKSQKAKG